MLAEEIYHKEKKRFAFIGEDHSSKVMNRQSFGGDVFRPFFFCVCFDWIQYMFFNQGVHQS